MDNIHPIQFQILRQLLFQPIARFSDLNLSNLTNDHFTFHIKRLVELSLVEKSSAGYTLTTMGKEFANRMDTDKLEVERQAKTGILVVPCRKSRAKTEYLIQQRLKQPFYGYHGFITGKIRWGETVIETALRELKEETGLMGIPSLTGIEHKIDYSTDSKLLEDKFFYVVKATKLSGELTTEFEGGKNTWLTKSQIFSLTQIFPDVKDILNLISNTQLKFLENKYIVSNY